MKILFIISLLFIFPFRIWAADLAFSPVTPMQGEPVLITYTGTSSISFIKSAYFGKQELNFFAYKGKIVAIGGVDLNSKVGTTTMTLNFQNGSKITKDIFIAKRPKVEAPIDIPVKLGGNTKQAAEKLLDNLVDEQDIISRISNVVRPKSYWKEDFKFPVKNPIVTDSYGYSRDTVGYSIAHKGTDFKASVSTPVFSINRGVVRDNKTYPTFGRTVIVDHGFGLYSMYMHLSKVKVNIGELVLPGQTVGLSGDSGYATGPHLHLTIRINGVSIDPMKFYELFAVKI